MPIGKPLAKLGSRVFRSSGFQSGVGKTVIGGSAAIGAVSGVMDRSGPYPGLAETAFGHRDALHYSIKSGVMTGAFPGQSVEGAENYYYGRPANVTGRTEPVSGEMVWGMYNMRRG